MIERPKSIGQAWRIMIQLEEKVKKLKKELIIERRRSAMSSLSEQLLNYNNVS